MVSQRLQMVIRHLRRAASLPEGAEPTDGELLECFVSLGEGAALEALVRRHAPMVWGAVRRALPSHHDAEDAFQATFLVLVRRAGAVVPRENVANWLHGVAVKTAMKARATAATRRARERQVAEMPEPAATPEDLGNDLPALLDQELSRVPDKYRAVLILCELEGKSRKEAARQLGLAEGTVASRLARGKELLAKRLARRGVAVPGAALAGALSRQTAEAGVPASVLSDTIKIMSRVAAGQAASELLSARVASLAEGVMRSMLLTKLKTVAAVSVFVLGLCGITGAALGLGQGPGAGNKPVPVAPDNEREGAAKPAKGPKPGEDVAALLKARLELAQKAYPLAVENLQRAQRLGNALVQVGKPEDVYNWSIRWLQAQRDMSARRADQIAALEAHLKRMTTLKAAVTQLARDLLPRIAVDQAEWYRLEAQLWLARAKAR